MNEMKYAKNEKTIDYRPAYLSKSVEQTHKKNEAYSNGNKNKMSPYISNKPKNNNQIKKEEFENEKLKEDTDFLFKSKNKFNQSFTKYKSPIKLNEIKGRNYNYINRNIKDDVRNLLFLDKSYLNPIQRVYEDFDNPLKINKKDYNETLSNPEKILFSTNINSDFKNDISNYEILKKKFINYIHLTIHNESLDERIVEKANKIKECENKKFKMSKKINDTKTKETYNKALEKRIIISFDDVLKFSFNYFFIIPSLIFFH